MKMHEPIVIALIALFGAVVGGMVSPIVDAFIRARVVNDKLVELAIDILKSTARPRRDLCRLDRGQLT